VRTVVRATTHKRVVDGWGNKMFPRAEIKKGQTYLADVYLVNGQYMCKIVKQLETQRKLLEKGLENYSVYKGAEYYEKYL
jgi:sRNA-binding regulator protein Hfq